jgi:photosystem II stability/assembly factor-like uncharacterized protein
MDSKLFQSLEWRSMGPHRGGRVVAVAGHPTEPGTFYFGGCAGGVWRTTNGGSYWENISDGFFETAAIGSIAVSNSHPNVIYVGTGEATIRGNVSHGDGVYKSVDGGHTFQNVGLRDTRHIGEVLVHPNNPDIVYVAALGHAWGPSEERGVFRSKDGGKTWQRVLYKSNRAGAVDLAMDPNQPEVLYATIWQTQRFPYKLESGGTDSGIWKTTDGGDTWTEITRNKGLPQDAMIGKVGVAASPARAGRVWAIVEAGGKTEKDGKPGPDEGGVFRSDDWGATWEKLATDANLRKRPWYYMHIFADTQDPDTVYVLNMSSFRSDDAGKTFYEVPTPHGDNHDLWLDPKNPNRRIQSDDGGGYISYDGGKHWSSILNQPTAQFYHVTADNKVPYNVYGSQQDNWAIAVPSVGLDGAIDESLWFGPGGGESGYIAVSPKPPHMVYGGGIGTGPGHGRLIAWNPSTRQKRNITVWPEVHGSLTGGSGAIEHKYRFQWTFPVEISPFDPDVLYACSNFVHRSRDEGSSWEIISPDLTRNDPTKLGVSGGPITADNSGAEIYCTIFAFRESPHERGMFWAGSDDGLVHISRDNGASWQNVTPPQLPEWALISIIEPSPHDAATAYVAATRYKHDDLKPYLFKTNDYGKTWTQITNGIPATDFTRTIREDPNKRGLLYAGTETGVYISFDDGHSWQRFQGNLPVVPIHDLMIKGTDLLAATHGRSFWALDDLSPLYQMSDATAMESAKLFKPRESTRFRVYGWPMEKQPSGYADYTRSGPITVTGYVRESVMGTPTPDFLDAGKNPPIGVIVHYFLKEKPEKPVTVRFLDQSGKELRSFTSDSETPPKVPAEAGANRFVWDMRAQPPTKLEGPTTDDRMDRMMQAMAAPKVVPGNYQVQLVVGDKTFTESFTIKEDPRLPVTQQDLVEQFNLKSQIRDRLSEVHDAVNQIRKMKKQIESWEERVKAGANGASGSNGARANGASASSAATATSAQPEDALLKAAKTLKDKLEAIEGKLILTNPDNPRAGSNQLNEKLATLSAMIDEADYAPTQGAREVYSVLAQQVSEQLQALQRAKGEEVRVFNEQVRSRELQPVGV